MQYLAAVTANIELEPRRSRQPMPQAVRRPGISTAKHDILRRSFTRSTTQPVSPSATSQRTNEYSSGLSSTSRQYMPLIQRNSLSDARPSTTQAGDQTLSPVKLQHSNMQSCVDVQPATSAPTAASILRTHSTTNMLARNVTPPSTSDTYPSTPARPRPEPQTPSHLVSTPGAKKPKWYVVISGRRTGIFDDW
jgi:hypothetical protein